MSLHQSIIQRAANWIIGYPRSGTMFLRSLLSNYFCGLERPLTLAEITGWTLGEHNEPFLVELTGKQPAERTIEEEWAVRPAYFERLRKYTNPVLPLIKSHTPNVTANGVPAFAFVPGDRLIHIVRHPCDVAVSAAHYYNITLEESVERLLRDDLYYHGAPQLGYELVGSWVQHTRSWLDFEGVPLCRVRYRDLVAQPARVLAELVAFLGVEPDLERAELAAGFAGFANLKQQESRDGLAEVAVPARDGYFRSGQVGQWLTQLTIEQAQRILSHDAELIDRLGFTKLTVG